MTFSNKTSVLALLFLTSNTAWSEPVNFCKAKRVYDNDLSMPAKIVYEDCSGVAFLWYARNYVKAACWEGAVDLLDGKCEQRKDDYQDVTPESPITEAPEQN